MEPPWSNSMLEKFWLKRQTRTIIVIGRLSDLAINANLELTQGAHTQRGVTNMHRLSVFSE